MPRRRDGTSRTDGRTDGALCGRPNMNLKMEAGRWELERWPLHCCNREQTRAVVTGSLALSSLVLPTEFILHAGHGQAFASPHRLLRRVHPSQTKRQHEARTAPGMHAYGDSPPLATRDGDVSLRTCLAQARILSSSRLARCSVFLSHPRAYPSSRVPRVNLAASSPSVPFLGLPPMRAFPGDCLPGPSWNPGQFKSGFRT